MGSYPPNIFHTPFVFNKLHLKIRGKLPQHIDDAHVYENMYFL